MHRLSRRDFSKALGASALLGYGGALFGSPGNVDFSSKRIALVVGNAKYSDNPLDNPTNDSESIAEQLKQYGFDVILLNNASKSEMLESTKEYGQQLRKNSAVGVFFYAGHAVQFDWKNYLIPVDAKVSRINDVPNVCFDLSELFTSINLAKNNTNLIFLDSCRDNPFGKRLKTSAKGLSQFDAPQGSLLAYATAPGNVASDGSAEHGLYTETLLSEMIAKDAKIEDVLKRVRLKVRIASDGKQIPWETTSLESDFSFNSKDGFSKSGRILRLGMEQQANTGLVVSKISTTNPKTNPDLSILTNQSLSKEQSPSPSDQETKDWELVSTSDDYKKYEIFLYRYPSGQYYMIAQARLDTLLAAKGEKKVQIINSQSNPNTKGSVTGLRKFSIGDSFSYELRDPFSNLVQSKYTDSVTTLSSGLIGFNNGTKWKNSLGNATNEKNQIENFPQFFPYEYQIGNSWSTSYINRFKNRVEARLKIADRRKLATNFGDFNAFVIEGDGQIIETKARIAFEFLIDPDRCSLPLSTKFITNSHRGNAVTQADHYVLVSFNQK